MDFSVMNENIRTWTEVGTLAFMIFTSWRVGRVARKLDDNHQLTKVLVHQTNDLTEKLMEKTDAAAEARGLEKGLAQQTTIAIGASNANIVSAIADAAAKVLEAATKQEAIILAAATEIAAPAVLSTKTRIDDTQSDSVKSEESRRN